MILSELMEVSSVELNVLDLDENPIKEVTDEVEDSEVLEIFRVGEEFAVSVYYSEDSREENDRYNTKTMNFL